MHAVNTTNYYGKISISSSAIAVVAGFCALECYGVVDLVSHSIKDSVKYLIKKQPYAKGVKITNNNNRITVDVYCIFKYGVSLSAVGESLKKAVKYGVENFTGMIVDDVNVHVCGVQV
ncbi:MAG: Asp23/Gls24 family envelope stress response protein [Clostridia bacterium]|nr:Asp23/Gls24 family envelope stress response protein [Clostridia bacterium]